MFTTHQTASDNEPIKDTVPETTPALISNIKALIWKVLRYSPDKTTSMDTINAAFEADYNAKYPTALAYLYAYLPAPDIPGTQANYDALASVTSTSMLNTIQTFVDDTNSNLSLVFTATSTHHQELLIFCLYSLQVSTFCSDQSTKTHIQAYIRTQKTYQKLHGRRSTWHRMANRPAD